MFDSNFGQKIPDVLVKTTPNGFKMVRSLKFHCWQSAILYGYPRRAAQFRFALRCFERWASSLTHLCTFITRSSYRGCFVFQNRGVSRVYFIIQLENKVDNAFQILVLSIFFVECAKI
jgi:hypothetical protein